MRSRPFSDPGDIVPTLALLTTLHARGTETDLPEISRLRTLLLTRLWQPEHDARLWLSADNRPLGFAGIFPPVERGTYLPLTIFARSDFRETIVGAALGWAEARAADRARTTGREALLCLTVVGDRPQGAAWPVSAGFVHLAEGDVVHLARPLQGLPAVPRLPEGFRLHPMPGPAELTRDSTAYAPILARRGLAQRRRLMTHPEYEPALEFLALAPDGTVAAYCETSLSRSSWALLGQRTGTIDWLASAPDLRRRGLGRALLTIALHRLRDAGAETAKLFTERTNTPARRLYRALGFVEEGEGRCYARSFGPQ